MKQCSCCNGPNDRLNQRYCRDCHNAYMRDWRVRRGGHAALSDEDRRRDNARSYLGVYVKRGKVRRETSCDECSDSTAPIEGHHHNGYDNPLDVRWLCRPCHKAEHRTVNYR